MKSKKEMPEAFLRKNGALRHSFLCHKTIHKDKMTDASCHDKQMEYLVGTEIRMLCVKYGKFQRVNNAPRRGDWILLTSTNTRDKSH